MQKFFVGHLLILCLGVVLPLTTVASPDYWIDVRSEQEYAESHVKDAAHIPYEVIREQIGSLTTDKDAEIFLYCGSGHRAGIAMNYLQSIGYTRVKNIGGLDQALKLEASPDQ